MALLGIVTSISVESSEGEVNVPESMMLIEYEAWYMIAVRPEQTSRRWGGSECLMVPIS